MKNVTAALVLSLLALSPKAFAGYDFDCTTANSEVTMKLVADGSDGGLDLLNISAFGSECSDGSIGQPWSQWRSSYVVDDSKIQAVWTMNDGVAFKFALISHRNQYKGSVTVSKAGIASQTLPMVCTK